MYVSFKGNKFNSWKFTKKEKTIDNYCYFWLSITKTIDRFSFVSLTSLPESEPCFSKIEGFSERPLFPFTGYQSFWTNEERAPRDVHSFLWVINLADNFNRLLYFISGNDRIMNPDVMERHNYLTEMMAGESCY